MYAVNISVPSAPTSGYYLISTSTGAWFPRVMPGGGGCLSFDGTKITTSTCSGGSGLTTLNGLTANPQYFATSGLTGLNITSVSDTHTFTLATSSATQPGFLSSGDWNTFNNKQSQLWGLSGTNLFASSTSWNVGIGTTTPTSKLQVIHDDNVTGGIQILHSNLTQGVGIGWDRIYKTGSSANSNLYVDAKGTGNLLFQTVATGNVGIGTTTPQYKLDLQGDLRVLTSSTLGNVISGVWQGTAIADAYISSAGIWNAKITTTSLSAVLPIVYNNTTGQFALSITAVSSTRAINTGEGLTGGGNLSADRTLSLNMAGITCDGNDKVSAISATGTAICSTDQTGGGGVAFPIPYASTTGFSFATSGLSGLTIASSTGTFTFNIATSSATTNGFLSSTDWNTFNTKITTTSLSSTATGLTYNNGTGAFSWTAGYVGLTTASSTSWTGKQDAITATTPLSLSSGILLMPTSTASQNGFLKATDWASFNAKITTTSLSATAPIVYNNTTGAFNLSILAVSSSRAFNTSATSGLTGGGDFSIDRNLILNMAGATCGAGTHINFLSATGTVTCSADTGGTSVNFPIPYASTTGFSFATSGITGLSIASSSGAWTFTIATATASQSGFLSSADWTIFNGKQPTITFPIAYGSSTHIAFPIPYASTTGFKFDAGNNMVVASSSGTWTFNVNPTFTSSTITNATTTYLNFTNATGTSLWASSWVSSTNAFFLNTTTTKLNGLSWGLNSNILNATGTLIVSKGIATTTPQVMTWGWQNPTSTYPSSHYQMRNYLVVPIQPVSLYCKNYNDVGNTTTFNIWHGITDDSTASTSLIATNQTNTATNTVATAYTTFASSTINVGEMIWTGITTASSTGFGCSLYYNNAP